MEDDRKANRMGEWCGEMDRGGGQRCSSVRAEVLGEEREQREKETLISWLGKLAKLIRYYE